MPILSWAGEPEWTAVEKEAGDLLSRYVQIDTTNPPGNEIAAANFWQQVLAREGIEAQVFESYPGRGVVYARLKGNGEKKALILLHHLDVEVARIVERVGQPAILKGLDQAFNVNGVKSVFRS